MKLVISYKNAYTPEKEAVVLATIELQQEIADELRSNMNSRLENKFLIDLASTERLGAIIVRPGVFR